MRISFVVQGPIHPIFTRECCDSIRRHFPEGEIVLSSWAGEDVRDLQYDKLILSGDIAPGKMNVRRQIVSSLNGINASSNNAIMKVRSDIIFNGRGCLDHFLKWTKRSSKLRVFSERMIIPNMQTIDPDNTSEESHWHRCLNPSDWVVLGMAEDMRYLFSLPADGADNTSLSPEQFIWVWAIKRKYDVELNDMNHITPELIAMTKQFFGNNLVVLDTYSQFQMVSGKYSYQKEEWPHFLRHSAWKRYYDEMQE